MRKYLFAALAGAALVWLTCPVARADVKPHALFGDGMVIQRDAPLVIWGKADAGEMVTVEELGGGKLETSVKGTTTADKEGNWRIDLPIFKVKVGEVETAKRTITVTGKNKVTIKDV